MAYMIVLLIKKQGPKRIHGVIDTIIERGLMYLASYPLEPSPIKWLKDRGTFPFSVGKESFFVRMILVTVLPAWKIVINNSRLRPKY